MQVNETLNEGLKRELEITVPATDMDARQAAYLNEIKDTIRLPGFRPGKVPMGHLKKVYGQKAMAEIVDQVVNETVRSAVEERGEKPALQPNVDVPNEVLEAILNGGVDLKFTMAYEVLPEFEIGDMSSIEVERPVADITDEEVDAQINRIAEGNRPYEAKDAKAKAADGDRLSLSYLGKLDGEPFEGGADEDAQLVLGSGQFIPGFEEQLIGVKAGDEKTITVTFPEEYPAEHLAGKEATFDVVIKGIEAPGEIVIDEEFATKLGLESLDKLKEIIKQQIEHEFGSQTRQKVKRQILDKLDEMHKFELPPTLVESEFEQIWNQLMGNMQQAGRTFEDEETTEDEAKAEYRAIAERRVRLGLVLSEVGEKNNVQVTDEEVQRALYDKVRQYPGQEQQVFEFYQKNQMALASLRAPIYEDKVVDFLMELAKVTDKTVSREELFEDDEDEE
ncbi:MAG: trigger factor [Hyphomicrobiales bacterium]|nr:MAG: trigger factor [Hyphomicrobiales bacterium]